MTAVKRLKLDREIWLDGEVPIELSYNEQRNGKAALTLGVNLVNADFRSKQLPGLLLTRSAGLVGSLTLLLNKHAITALSSLRLSGPESAILVEGIVDEQYQQKGLKINQFKVGDNSFKGELGFKPNSAMSILIRGESLNLDILSEPKDNPFAKAAAPADPAADDTTDPAEAESQAGQKTAADRAAAGSAANRNQNLSPEMIEIHQPFEPRFPLLLDVTLDRLILGKERILGYLFLKGYYDGERWQEASLDTLLSNRDPLSLRLKPSEEFRSLEITSTNSGELFRIITGKQIMTGGALSVIGRVEARPRGLTATVTIQKFRMANSAGFNRFVSMLTITGIFDALSGDGMAFDELKLDLSHSGLVTRIRNGHLAGSALGLTVQGTITDPDPSRDSAQASPRLNLEGTAVPAYGVSNTIKAIPLVGWLLTGDKGQGLIAFSYTVLGDLSNPKVTVNPLSILAPGFIQNWIKSINKNKQNNSRPLPNPSKSSEPSPSPSPSSSPAPAPAPATLSPSGSPS